MVTFDQVVPQWLAGGGAHHCERQAEIGHRAAYWRGIDLLRTAGGRLVARRTRTVFGGGSSRAPLRWRVRSRTRQARSFKRALVWRQSHCSHGILEMAVLPLSQCFATVARMQSSSASPMWRPRMVQDFSGNGFPPFDDGGTGPKISRGRQQKIYSVRAYLSPSVAGRRFHQLTPFQSASS